jgi:hypothetical protein
LDLFSGRKRRLLLLLLLLLLPLRGGVLFSITS